MYNVVLLKQSWVMDCIKLLYVGFVADCTSSPGFPQFCANKNNINIFQNLIITELLHIAG